MILEIKFNGKFYLANVKRGKFTFDFKLERYNGFYSWSEIHGFQKFSCSLACRLKHYKDFKARIFNQSFSRRFIERKKN